MTAPALPAPTLAEVEDAYSRGEYEDLGSLELLEMQVAARESPTTARRST